MTSRAAGACKNAAACFCYQQIIMGKGGYHNPEGTGGRLQAGGRGEMYTRGCGWRARHGDCWPAGSDAGSRRAGGRGENNGSWGRGQTDKCRVAKGGGRWRRSRALCGAGRRGKSNPGARARKGGWGAALLCVLVLVLAALVSQPAARGQCKAGQGKAGETSRRVGWIAGWQAVVVRDAHG